MIKAIVCVDRNWAIGKNNELLFHIKEDMKLFTQMTANCIVCMGENTLLSLPGKQPLKNRANMVLCKEGHEYNNCICYYDFNKLVNDLQILSQYITVWVIGGGQFYKSMLPYCEEVLVTKVEAEDKEATVFFPNLDKDSSYELISTSDIMESNNYNFTFNTYRRIK